MQKLVQSKERLKVALANLEKVIEARLARLELENQALKIELMKKNTSSTRKKTVKDESTDAENDDMVDSKVLNAVDLSLKELKKLVG